MTSGSPGIDYFVSSQLFETAVSIDGREARRIAGTASDISAVTGAEGAADDDEEYGTNQTFSRPAPFGGDIGQPDTTASSHRRLHPRGNLPRTRTQPLLAEENHDNSRPQQQWQGRGGDGAQDYTEQLVLFDSLTASLPDVVGPAHAPSSAVAAVAAAARVSSSTAAALGPLLEGDHLYHCIQHSKKFHPDFDPVLRGVLQSDPAAKILLSAASEVRFYPTRYGCDTGAPQFWRKHTATNKRCLAVECLAQVRWRSHLWFRGGGHYLNRYSKYTNGLTAVAFSI